MASRTGVLVSIQILIFLLIPTALVHFKTSVNHPNAGLNVTQLLDKFGYASETHYVVTEDGYILTLFRIPQKKFNNITEKIPSTPVLVYHGMHSSAADYICTGPGKGLGLLLADNNYDVWLGNFRGTTYSRNHTKLDPDKDKDEFWAFNLDDFGLYDLPASVDYILNNTGKSEVNYIGCSQSASVALITLSERPEYLEKIKFLSLFCPAVFMKNTESPALNVAVRIQGFFNFLRNLLGNIELAPAGGLVASSLRTVCNDKNSFLFYICKLYCFVIQQNVGLMDQDNLSVITTNFPAGVSALQQIQLVQLASNEEFVKFDFGREGNLVKYGQDKPPAYELSKITTPIAIYYSKYDKIVNADDVKRLIQSLPNVVKDNLITHENFNHLDFVLGVNASEIVYYSVLEELEKY